MIENDSVISHKKRPILINSLAAATTSAILLPFDYFRVQYVLASEGKKARPVSPFSFTSNLWKQGGKSQFYKGFDAISYRSAVSTSLKIFVYQSLLESKSKDSTLTGWQQIKFMAFSNACGAFLTTPFDVVLTRIQSDNLLPLEKRRNYTSALNGLKTIYKEEGPLVLWRGGLLVFLRSFGFTFVNVIASIMTHNDRLVFFSQLFGYVIGGLISLSFIIPIENIKIKYQHASTSSDKYSGVFDCLTKSIKNEGLKGLYVGSSIYALRIIPWFIVNKLSIVFMKTIFEE